MCKNMESTNTYLYPNYLKAAVKKLNACKLLLSKCSDLSNEQSKGICHELYYLSGYIVECFCVYSIYKILGWEDENVPINEDKLCDYEVFEDKNKVSFYGNKSKQIYCIKSHLYSTYVDVLRKTQRFKGIPYFSTLDFSSLEVQDLVNGWDPQIRYNYDEKDGILKYANKENLKEIFDWCDIVRERIEYI